MTSPAPLPDEVVHALAGRPQVGSDEQAVLLLTVRDDGTPHVTLLSRAEVDADGAGVRLALAGTTTPRNLDRDGLATLFVVAGTTAYSCELQVLRRHDAHGMAGFVTEVAHVRADSLGIPLVGVRFHVPSDLPSVERWDASARLLAELT